MSPLEVLPCKACAQRKHVDRVILDSSLTLVIDGHPRIDQREMFRVACRGGERRMAGSPETENDFICWANKDGNWHSHSWQAIQAWNNLQGLTDH